jgi:hypothetical protein
LHLDENTSKEDKETMLKTSIEKEATYLNLYTGESDQGKKVTNETIEFYFKRYNLPEDKTKKLLNPPTQKCFVCKKDTNKRCTKCHLVFYCDRQCQSSDWNIHKHYCNSLPIPPKVNGNSSVVGVLLEENSLNPTFVQVPLYSEIGESHVKTNVQKFLKVRDIGRYWLEYNPLKNNKQLGNTLLFHYRDNFLNDGSQPNKCVSQISSGRNPHGWRGPMLVTKSKGYITKNRSSEGFLDVELTDFSDIIDFFLFYGSDLNKKMTSNNYDHLKKYNFQFFNLD